MSARLPAFLLCALLAVAQALPANYYPRQPGTKWTYSSGETQIVGQQQAFKGVQITPVNHQYGDILVTQELLEYRQDGSVWLRGLNANGKLNWYTQPLLIYPAGPLVPGKVWRSKGGGIERVSQVTGTQALISPLGSFNALVINVQTLTAGQSSVQLNYFVPNLGIVRIVTADGQSVDLVSR